MGYCCLKFDSLFSNAQTISEFITANYPERSLARMWTTVRHRSGIADGTLPPSRTEQLTEAAVTRKP